MLDIRRRQLLIAIGALLTPPIAYAQQAEKKWRIGFLSLDRTTSEAGQMALALFPAALDRLGYREGKNLEIEWRWAEGKSEDLAKLAAGLVRLPVDVIVARTSGPIAAAKNATRTIPIVMFNGNYPVELGLVESLARPGGNVTGTSYLSLETHAKQIQLLREIAPNIRRLAVPWYGSGKTRLEQLVRDSLANAAGKFGMAVQYFEFERSEEITGVLKKIAASKNDALWYRGDPVLRSRQEEIIALTRAQKMATVSNIPGFADEGGLVDYSPDAAEFLEQTASYVDRILKGARPADLPVHQPTKYQLVINLKTARAIGINVPQQILMRTDRVIE